jgi:hypothetical protein
MNGTTKVLTGASVSCDQQAGKGAFPMTFSVAPTSAADPLTTAHDTLDVEKSKSIYRRLRGKPRDAKFAASLFTSTACQGA